MLYLREDAIADPVDVFLHQVGGSKLAANPRKLAEAQHRQVAKKGASAPDEEQLRLTVAECDAKLISTAVIPPSSSAGSRRPPRYGP